MKNLLLTKLILSFSLVLYFSNFVNGQCTIPVSDNFDGTSLDTNIWVETSASDPNNWINSPNVLNPPSPPNALQLDGNPSTSDTVVTCTIDLSTAPAQTLLQFSVQMAGNGNVPEPQDSLICEYYNFTNNWIPILALPGGTVAESNFTDYSFVLPGGAFHPNFKVRFRNYATAVINPNAHNDTWFIDDFYIGEEPPPPLPCYLPIFDDFEAGSLNPTFWNPSDNDGNNWVNSPDVENPPSGTKALELNGNPDGVDVVETCVLDLSFENNVKVEFHTERGGGANTPEANDSLICEYRTDDNSWEPLLELEGGSAQNFFVFHTFTLPQNAYHPNFKIRFRNHATTSQTEYFDVWYIDDFHIFSQFDVAGPNIFFPTEIENNDNFTSDFPTSALIFDNSGVEFAKLHYRFGDFGSFTEVAMTEVQENYYNASIPMLQNVQTSNVYYYFSARDSLGNTSYSPQNILQDPENNVYKFTTQLVKSGSLISDADSNSVSHNWGQPGTNSLELKYDDGTSEFQSILPGSPSGLNNPNNSTFASKFNLSEFGFTGNGLIDSVKIFIPTGAIPTAEYKVKILSATQNGFPNNVIAETDVLQQTSPFGDFVKIDFVDQTTGLGVEVGNGDFFVAVEQVGIDRISLGGDTSLNLPFLFKNNNFYLQIGTSNWSLLEALVPLYGQVIPMIRCYVSDTEQIQSSYPVSEFKLYRRDGNFKNGNWVVQGGSVVYNGNDLSFVDTGVTQGNIYSYATTVVYDINGNLHETDGSNATQVFIGTGTGPSLIFTDSETLKFFNSAYTTAPNIVGSDSVTIYNVGGQTINVTGITLSGANASDFAITSPTTFTIEPGQSEKVFVELNVNTIDTFLATLEIQHDAQGTPIQVSLEADITFVSTEEQKNVPKEFSLSQNFPNPFNPSTKISYDLGNNKIGKITIFNILGEKVNAFELVTPKNTIVWNGANSNGRQVSSGVYFYKLEAGKFSQTRKMLFLK